MDPVVYEGCRYEGGFAGMSPNASAILELGDEMFVLRRPRSFSLSRRVRKLWAKWPAVTELRVLAADDGARLEITTKQRGTGAIVLAGVPVEELWEVLDGLADLKERFHGEPGAPVQADAGETDGGDAADAAEEPPAGSPGGADDTGEPNESG